MARQNLFSDFAVQCNSKAVPRQIITFDKNKKCNNNRFIAIKPVVCGKYPFIRKFKIVSNTRKSF